MTPEEFAAAAAETGFTYLARDTAQAPARIILDWIKIKTHEDQTERWCDLFAIDLDEQVLGKVIADQRRRLFVVGQKPRLEALFVVVRAAETSQ